jgi:hypothetical protein
MFITAFTSAPQLFPFWATSFQSTHLSNSSLIFIIILYSHLILGLQNYIFPSVSPPNPCTHLSHPTYLHVTCPAHHHPNNIWYGGVLNIMLSVMHSSSIPFYFILVVKSVNLPSTGPSRSEHTISCPYSIACLVPKDQSTYQGLIVGLALLYFS